MIRIDIINTGLGTPESGQYNYHIRLPGRTITGHLKDYDRSRGWAALVNEIVKQAQEKQIADDLTALLCVADAGRSHSNG